MYWPWNIPKMPPSALSQSSGPSPKETLPGGSAPPPPGPPSQTTAPLGLSFSPLLSIVLSVEWQAGSTWTQAQASTQLGLSDACGPVGWGWIGRVPVLGLVLYPFREADSLCCSSSSSFWRCCQRPRACTSPSSQGSCQTFAPMPSSDLAPHPTHSVYSCGFRAQNKKPPSVPNPLFR